MAGAVSRAQLLRELEPGLNALFGLEYKRYPEQHKLVYDTFNSDRSFEEELRVTGLGLAQTTEEGGGVPMDTMQESYVARWRHETVKLGFQVTEEAMEDNLYQSLSERGTRALARSFAETKQIKAMVPLNLGFTSYTTADAQYAFDTDHPLINGGVNANRPNAGADLNETSLEAAIIAMSTWTDDRGLLVNARPTRLIIPSALEFTAERILKTEQRPGTMDNDINAIKSTGRIPGGWAVINYLTDTNAWFLKTDITNGYKMFQRVAMKKGMEGDFDTGNVKYKGRERYSFGIADPLGMYGSPGGS
jgi:hypothetical protein